MGEFNSEDHCIYYCGQESHRRNGVALISNQSPKCSTSVKSHKQQNDLSSFPRQTVQHSNPSLCPNQWCRKNEVDQFYEDLQGLLELTPKKDILFLIEDWNAKAVECSFLLLSKVWEGYASCFVLFLQDFFNNSESFMVLYEFFLTFFYLILFYF